jgi:hypothetical protein
MLEPGLILEMLGHIVFHLHLILGWFFHIILVLIIESTPVLEICRSFVFMCLPILHFVSAQL